MLVHAGAVLVVLLAVPLVAVLAQVTGGQLGLKRLRGRHVTSLRLRLDGGPTRSSRGADEAKESRCEDEDPREPEARDDYDRAHHGAEDRGRVHAGAREEKGLGPVVDPTTGDDRAEARDCMEDANERGGARSDRGPDRQDAARECEQESAQAEGTPQGRGFSEDAGEHAALLVAGGICRLRRGLATTGSHPPKRVLPAFDCANLVERRELVVGQVRPPPERARIRFREVHVQDVAAVDLPPDRDAVHRDRDFLSLVRAFEGFLPAPDCLDSSERPAIRAHDRLPRTDPTGQDADSKDRRLRGPEDMFSEEEERRGVRDLLSARLGQLPFPLVPPRLIVFDETVDHIVLEQLQVRMSSEGGLRVRQDLQVEGEDRAGRRILRRRGVRDVPSRDRSEPGELDGDRRLLALVCKALEGTDRVRLHEDSFVLRLDVDLGFLRDLLDDGGSVPFRRADRRARDGLLEPAADELDSGGGGDALHRVEPLLRVPNLIQGFRLQEGFHLRRPRLARGPEDDRVAFRERALVDDRVEGDPEALLLLHLEDRTNRRPFRGRELFLEEPLGEADEGEQQVRDALAELRADRDHREVRREVLDPVVSVGRETVLEQSTHEIVPAAVELLPRGLRLILVRADERLPLVLPPTGHHVDLVRGDDERGLVPPQDVQALDRLWAESLVNVDDEDREVGERTAAGAQGREGHVARCIDEEKPGDAELPAFDEVPAHLEDRRERDFRRADVLRDPAGFAACHAGPPDPVEEGRLA